MNKEPCTGMLPLRAESMQWQLHEKTTLTAMSHLAAPSFFGSYISLVARQLCH